MLRLEERGMPDCLKVLIKKIRSTLGKLEEVQVAQSVLKKMTERLLILIKKPIRSSASRTHVVSNTSKTLKLSTRLAKYWVRVVTV